MSSIRVSPRHIGKMKSNSFCPQCYWYQILTGFRPPFESPMPGIMYNLDRFEKLIVEAHFKDKGTAPRWLKELGCTEVVGFPAKLTMEFPALELTLVGMPDAVFRKKDGSLYLVDYKKLCKKPFDSSSEPNKEGAPSSGIRANAHMTKLVASNSEDSSDSDCQADKNDSSRN